MKMFQFKKSLFGYTLYIHKRIPLESPGSFKVICKRANKKEMLEIMKGIKEAYNDSDELFLLKKNNPELFI